MKRHLMRGAALATIVAVGLTATVPAFAGGRGGKMFDRLDTDSDGKITQQEFNARHSERFKQMDTDGDGHDF